jgi:hypothetical protein
LTALLPDLVNAARPMEDHAPTQATQAAAGAYALTLPAARQRTADHMVYRIVSAQVLSEAPGKRQLQVRVQASNQDRYDANPWAASFRLQVQGALQAPSSELNELLPSHSSQQARLSFDIADDAQSADLQMGQVGEGAPGITLDLRRPSPWLRNCVWLRTSRHVKA